MIDNIVIAKLTDGTFIIGQDRGDGIMEALQVTVTGDLISLAFPFEREPVPHFVPNNKVMVMLEEDTIPKYLQDIVEKYRKEMD